MARVHATMALEVIRCEAQSDVIWGLNDCYLCTQLDNCHKETKQSGEMGIGIMVLGVDEEQAKSLEENEGLVTLFSKQTGVCIQSIRFQNDYAIDIHDKKD